MSDMDAMLGALDEAQDRKVIAMPKCKITEADVERAAKAIYNCSMLSRKCCADLARAALLAFIAGKTS